MITSHSHTAARWILIPLLVQTAFGAGSPRLGTAERFATRDLEIVRPACDPVVFIVSLNNDDDDLNGREDRKQRRISPTDDNLRQFTFKAPAAFPGAAKVYVAEPVMVATGTSAVGRTNRVRGYRDDRRTAFEFNRLYDLPLTLYLEGVKVSDRKQDFGFEYQFADANEKYLPCGGGAQGTVVNVEAGLKVEKGDGKRFRKHDKMLIGADGRASAVVQPAGFQTIAWSYDGTATVAPPNRPATALTAGLVPTNVARRDRDELRFRVTEAGLHVEAHNPVNITAPVHADPISGWTNGRPKDSPRRPQNCRQYFDANRGTFSLFRTHIDYRLLDQFHDPIKESAWGTRVVQVRENIGNVMTSPLPAVRAWIQQQLRWTQNWKTKKNGKIEDKLRAFGLPKDVTLAPRNPANPGRRRFHPTLRAVGGVLFNLGTGRHEWEASVNGDHPTVVTQNQLSVVVHDTCAGPGDTNIQLRSTYQITTP